MGLFLVTSAFHDRNPSEVAVAITEYLGECEVSCGEVGRGEEVDDHRDAFVFPVTERWTVVVWPADLLGRETKAAAAMSASLAALASTIHIYDSEYWGHVLLESGEVLDRFASCAHSSAVVPAGAGEGRMKWGGNPNAIAARLDVPADAIRATLLLRRRGRSTPMTSSR